jgi:hypothetical protein
MKAGRVIIYATETLSKITLESKQNNIPWGMVEAIKPCGFAKYNLQNIAVQLLVGINDKKYRSD